MFAVDLVQTQKGRKLALGGSRLRKAYDNARVSSLAAEPRGMQSGEVDPVGGVDHALFFDGLLQDPGINPFFEASSVPRRAVPAEFL